ncbi:MAG: spore germination protein [Ruminiclostridium sp.]|nr:spore germination protein [Ruminiclostridium sp.]
MSMGILLLLFHLASVETFGVPYLSPFTSSEGRDLEDNII